MKIKEIEFVEHYIEKEPESENQWRGIIVEINGVRVATINYWDHENKFNISEGCLSNILYLSRSGETVDIFPSYISYETKEEAIQAVRDGIQRYFEFFLEV